MHLYHDVDRPLLILGPTGSGKSTLAKEIHALSPRSRHPFVILDLAGLRPELIESELYGHVKGSFTGAHIDRKGHLQETALGTLFLDEIGELDMEAQKRLLRVLDEGTFSPVGSCNRLNFEGRIIMATHQNLEALVEKGKFREDLYYRVNVFVIKLRSLCEDKIKLRQVIEDVWKVACAQFNKDLPALDHEIMEVLIEHSWPGNYRELKNCLERLAYHTHVFAKIQDLNKWSLMGIDRSRPVGEFGANDWALDYGSDMQRFEKRYLEHLLLINNGKINETCRRHGVCKSTLMAKMRKYDITTWKSKTSEVHDQHDVQGSRPLLS